MSSGRTGPFFSPPKRKQKPPKAFPLWILPCLEPQAKARERDARFRSPAHAVQN